ncbi:hypothetical protein BT63DRAFT_451781 [Microthyrium microscopicum]|uniref:Uncharacterized protein n=1 Tax=Microthyrium microscopicum TaxID=703497 RepID=A0A6A6UNA9_9PEZI|nr:hypothetical protein BT63DRAFT_451781 [Microthyrium microscopicum]
MPRKPRLYTRIIDKLNATARPKSFMGDISDLFKPAYTTPPPPRTTLRFTPQDIPYSEIEYPSASPLGCPAEIRLLIYSHLFTTPIHRPSAAAHSINAHHTLIRLHAIQSDKGLTPESALLLVSRQIFHETRPLLHRTALLVPSNIPTLPLQHTRLASIPPTHLQRLGVRDLVLRDYITALPSIAQLETWLSAGVLSPLELDIEDVYLQLCTCNGSNHPTPGTRDFVETRVAPVVAAVAALGYGLKSVKRVVVYYCGTKGTMGLGPRSARIYVEGMGRLFGGKMVAGWSSRWDDCVRIRPAVEGEKKEEDGGRYIVSCRRPGEVDKKAIEVDFHDSFVATGKQCVLA